MGDKVDPKVIKKTQDILGKIVKKPPLTEKLLGKPPFRFLHDVMTSVIKSTGFMKGLFTENEMHSENVKEKDSKIAFLQKVIDIISLVVGKPLSAKPSKIVAGQEPDRTNEMLQKLAEAANKKVDNDDYVRRVLKGDSKPPSGSSKKEGDKKKREKDDGKKADDRREKSSDKSRDKSRDDRDKSRDKSRDRDKKDSSSSRDKSSRDKADREKSRDRRDQDKDKGRERSKDRDKDEGERKDRDKDRERRKRREEKIKEAEVNGEAAPEDTPQRIPRPTSAKGSRRRHGHEEEHVRQRERERSSKSRDRDAGQRSEVKEDDLPPQVTAARKMARPSSARPAPPKVKKNEGQEDPVMIGSSNVPNLIVDKDSSDEDEGFMAKEEDEPAPVIAPQRANDTETEGEHGGLVKKILETKKELEGSNQPAGAKKTEIERSSGVSDAARRKEREHVQKEIDRLRTSIQTLTRSVNPLGKILDFLQEDLDSMQKELVVWQAENKENAVALSREQSITESSVEPLKAQLAELDSAIGDQLDLIAAVKHNTIRNDDKIEKMLSTVTKS